MSGASEREPTKGAASLGRSFIDAASPTPSTRSSTSRPFSIRLSSSERQRLEEAAGSVPLGSHIKSQLLGAPLRKTPRRAKPDSVALGQILASLGRSRLSSGIADLAEAARTGTIVLTPETDAQVAALAKEVAEVRQLLMRALGLVKDQTP